MLYGPKLYSLIPDNIHAMIVSSDNIKEAAAWCGGEVAVDGNLFVPTLDGSELCKPGEVVYKRDIDGRFSVMTNEEFSAKWRIPERPRNVRPLPKPGANPFPTFGSIR